MFSQLGEDTFNRAKLLNVGYREALKEAAYDCFIFSDVDLIPMDDRNLYHCYDQPRHFAIAMDKFGFRWEDAVTRFQPIPFVQRDFVPFKCQIYADDAQTLL